MKNLMPQKVTIEGAERFQRLLAGPPQTSGMKSGAVILQPGESIGEHSTDAREEAIIVLEGRVEVLIGGKAVFAAGRNDLVYIPPHTRHDMKNSAGEIARYVYVVVPAPAD